ncbi:MAG: hypothetical protein PVJ36_00215, partial [Nitrospirota bacterium]
MRRRLGVIAIIFTLLFTLSNAASYQDGPPPAITGGFGESDCRECHFDRPVNPPEGYLSVVGLNGKFKAGEQY